MPDLCENTVLFVFQRPSGVLTYYHSLPCGVSYALKRGTTSATDGCAQNVQVCAVKYRWVCAQVTFPQVVITFTRH